MRKKLIALLMAAMMLLSLAAACGNEPAPTPDPAPSTDPTPAPTPADPTPAPADPTPADPDADKYGGDLVIAVGSGPNTMDPHHSGGSTANYQWMQNIFEPTISMGSDGQFYPMTCDFEYAEDGSTLKLWVVEGKKFSDGTPVTIEDVMASWERVSAMGGAFATKVMDNVTEIKIEGDTATVYFSKMNPTMMEEIADARGAGYIIPKAICEKYGAEKIDNIEDVIGSGPYKLEVYEPTVEVKLSRNDNYVITNNDAPGLAAPKKAFVDTITYSINGDTASRTAAMIAGEYHVGSILTDMQAHADKVGLKSVLQYNQWTHACFFNLDPSNADSPVADVNFRKAFRAALDMKAIMLSIMSGAEERIDMNISPIPTNNTAYYNDILEKTDYNVADVELAKEYLAKTDYNGEPIVWLTPASGSFYRAAVAASQSLEKVGIMVEIKTVDSGSHSAMRADPATGHDIGAWEVQKAASNPFASTSLTGQGAGWWASNKKTELLGVLGSTPTGSKESVQAYQELCQLIADEVPWVGFGTAISKTYTAANFEMNYEGMITYYWNSYFTK